jgi:formylglycine-generating enzyme required for sulfatase activity
MDPAGSSALTVEDQFLLKIAHKNGILESEQASLAIAEVERTGKRLEEVLVQLRLLSDRQLSRLREAMAASQVIRLDALYAGIIKERALLPAGVLERAFAAQRQQHFRVRLGNILLKQGAISPAIHRKIITATIKRLRSQGQDAYGTAVESIPIERPEPPSRPAETEHETEPLKVPRGLRSVDPGSDPFETKRSDLSPLFMSSKTDMPSPAASPFAIPMAETQELKPSLFTKSSDGEYRALLEGLSPEDLAEPGTDSFLASAIQIGLNSDDSLGFNRSDGDRLEIDLLESKELPESNFVLDRLEIASGESTEFLPDEYVRRRRGRTRALQIGAAVLVLVVLLAGGTLLVGVMGNRRTLAEVRGLLDRAETAPTPAERLPLLRSADTLLAGISGPGVGDTVRRELSEQLRWGLLRAEALQILEGGDASGAKTLLEARAGHVPSLAKSEHAELVKRVERETLLREAQDAERRRDVPSAVSAYRRALELGDPGGLATARLTAIYDALVSAMNKAYAEALKSLKKRDEDIYFESAKQIHDLFSPKQIHDLFADEAGPSERIEEIRFRRAMRNGDTLFERGKLEDAQVQFEVALKLRPNNPRARERVERATNRRAQRTDEELGREADARKDYEAAIEAYERAKKHSDPSDKPRLDAAIAGSRRKLHQRSEQVDRRRRRREALTLMRESKVSEAIALIKDLVQETADTRTTALLAFALQVKGMIYVPPGDFLMGSKKRRSTRAIERPQHTVKLPGYFIDRTEVTNKAYAEFVATDPAKSPAHWSSPVRQKDGSVRQSYDRAVARHPLVSITWAEARAYAKWRHGDLPTEEQWEKAARGADGRTYPWGPKTPVRAHIEIRPSRLRAHKTAAVGTHVDDRSPYGVMDMGGNVNEWTLDLLVPYPGAPKDASAAKGRRAIRGGAYRWPYRDARCAARDSMQETYTSDTVGFRVVIAVPESVPPLR